MAKLISQSCGELQPAIGLPRGYAAILRWPEHSWTSDKDPHFITKTNPFRYKTVIFEIPEAQLRICGWPIPVTSLSLSSINPPPLHSLVFWKFVEAVLLPTNAVTTSCNATSRHGLGIVEESGFCYYGNSYLSGLP